MQLRIYIISGGKANIFLCSLFGLNVHLHPEREKIQEKISFRVYRNLKAYFHSQLNEPSLSSNTVTNKNRWFINQKFQP